MLIKSNSSYSTCIPVQICHPHIKNCFYPKEYIYIPNCCSQESIINFQEDISKIKNKISTYELNAKEQLSPNLNNQKSQKYIPQTRNSTPSLMKYSKTNSYFNIMKNIQKENYSSYNSPIPININNNIDSNIDSNNKNISLNQINKQNINIENNNTYNNKYRHQLRNNSNKTIFPSKYDINNNNNNKRELIDKIKCMSHRLNSAIRNLSDLNKDLIEKQNYKVNSYNNRRINSDDNLTHNKNLNTKKYKARNSNRYLDELHKINSEYDLKDTFLEKMKKKNEREKQIINMKIKNISDIVNKSSNIYNKVSNNLLEIKKGNENIIYKNIQDEPKQ